MSAMFELLHEQLLDYSEQLKTVEKEMIQKYKAQEDFQEELVKANGLKLLQKEVVRMMSLYGGNNE